MIRCDKRVVKEKGKYSVVEIEIIDKATEEIIDKCYEVRESKNFLTEFDNE